MLFYGHTLPPSTLDEAAVVRQEYQQLREVVERYCPPGEVRTRALHMLADSLLGALLALRLKRG